MLASSHNTIPTLITIPCYRLLLSIKLYDLKHLSNFSNEIEHLEAQLQLDDTLKLCH